MPPVRPSSLQIAKSCKRAPWLSLKFKEGSAATEEGREVDDEVSGALASGRPVTLPESEAIVEWVRSRWPDGSGVEIHVQRKIALVDPETGETITEGTADFVVVARDAGRVTIVDWKKKGQWWAGHLAPPDKNLQQHAYAIGAMLEFGCSEYQIILGLFDGNGIDPRESRVYGGDEPWKMFDEIKAVPPVDPDAPEPEATKGDHCLGCYQRLHCSAYLLPTSKDAPAELQPFMAGELTPETAAKGLEWLKKADAMLKAGKELRDQVKAQLETYALQNGPIVDAEGKREWGPIPTNGKRSGASVAELEAAGLSHLIKEGKPGIKFDWKKRAA